MKTRFIAANHCFHFGKYEGQKVRDVIEKDPKYVQWCLDNLKWLRFNGRARELLHLKIQKVNAEV
jgi:hypothetical protein